MTLPKTQRDVPAWIANTPSDAHVALRMPQALRDAVAEHAKARGEKTAYTFKRLIAEGLIAAGE